MPARIVTSTYRYKPPLRKRKAVPLEGPAIVRARRVGPLESDESSNVQPATAQIAPADSAPRSAIVTAKRRPGRFGDVPDMTPEEHRRRGDAADALFREMVRLAAARD